VRHVRMLGLLLAAALIVSAAAAVPTMAAKDPFNTKTWEQYKFCPYNINPGLEDCFVGRTAGGKEGGFFELGNAKVPLSKPITLQGGFCIRGLEFHGVPCEEALGAEPGALKVFPAANGGETLESPELKVERGLSLITTEIQAKAEWPQALKESFKQAKANKETALVAKVELAGGNLLYEEPNALSTEHLLFEQGNAFELPLKVKMTNSWLAKLGGGPCTVGNETHPIMQDLTTEPPGRATEPGGFTSNEEFTNIELKGGRLIDLNWPVEEGADASGCGGEFEPFVDKAINLVLELPHQHGITILQGDLFTGQVTAVKEHLEP
jgi:hypothetical protein